MSTVFGHIEARDINISFKARSGKVQAVESVSLHVQPGEFVSLIGPSGCGKFKKSPSATFGYGAGSAFGTKMFVQHQQSAKKGARQQARRFVVKLSSQFRLRVHAAKIMGR